MGFYPPSYVRRQQHPDTLCSSRFPLPPFRKEKQITVAVFSLMVLSIYCLFSPLSFPACVLLPPVSVGLRRGAGASLTGVWVLIAHVCALISGPQLPASSLLHASEWGYISLSLWPETFLSISLGLSLSRSHTQPCTLADRQDEAVRGFRHHHLTWLFKKKKKKKHLQQIPKVMFLEDI